MASTTLPTRAPAPGMSSRRRSSHSPASRSRSSPSLTRTTLSLRRGPQTASSPPWGARSCATGARPWKITSSARRLYKAILAEGPTANRASDKERNQKADMLKCLQSGLGPLCNLGRRVLSSAATFPGAVAQRIEARVELRDEIRVRRIVQVVQLVGVFPEVVQLALPGRVLDVQVPMCPYGPVRRH